MCDRDSTFPIARLLQISWSFTHVLCVKRPNSFRFHISGFATNFLVVYTRFVCESARFHISGLMCDRMMCAHYAPIMCDRVMCASCDRITIVHYAPIMCASCDREAPFRQHVSEFRALQIPDKFPGRLHTFCVCKCPNSCRFAASCVRIMHPSCVIA